MPPPRILLADDDADTAAAYEVLLRGHGYRTDIATDGLGALAQVLEQRPDLVVLDLGLPRIDGFEVLRRLRSDPRVSATPVVVVTGFAFPRDVERARLLGSAAVLTKPCDPGELCRTIAALVGPRAQPPRGPQRESWTKARPAGPKPRRRSCRPPAAGRAPGSRSLESLVLWADFLARHAEGLRREAKVLIACARTIRVRRPQRADRSNGMAPLT